MEKLYNDKIIEPLAEIEYSIRDGLILTEEQKIEIAVICNQIIRQVNG